MIVNSITLTYSVKYTAESRARQQARLAALALGSADGSLAKRNLAQFSKTETDTGTDFSVVQVLVPIDQAKFDVDYPTLADVISVVANLWTAVFFQATGAMAEQVSVVVA